MRIALAQLNPIVGDRRGNTAAVLDAAKKAVAVRAELLVTTEMVISGYPPKDLLLREGFVEACDDAVLELARQLPPALGVLVGHPTRWNVPDGRAANAVSLLEQGRVAHTVHKCLLPNYDVFDERRYFLPALQARPIPFRGLSLGVHICEDAWFGEPGTAYQLPPENRRDPLVELAEHGAQLFLNLSASPFEVDKFQRRVRLARRHVQRHRRPFVFVNQFGGNDDLVFDGQSFVLSAQGELQATLAPFATDFAVVDVAIPSTAPTPAGPVVAPNEPVPQRGREAQLLDALITGLGDYARKCGFPECVLGLSGGIDSALAAYVAAQAFGPDKVHGLAMPSRYSSDHSVTDAAAIAKNLGLHFDIIPIDTVHRAYEATPVVGPDLLGQPGGLSDQNLQARIRGALVMTRSNRYGWLALATGNKSELAVGYCTLYGDMCGGFAVLADLYKRDVYAISRYINAVREGREAIPEGSIGKAPSAELAPNQFDQDTLPPYPVLDAILEGLIDDEESVASLSQRFPPETVRWVATRLDRNEFKRRQAAPGIKLSPRAFGTGRRMPMAARFE